MARVARFGADPVHVDRVVELPVDNWKAVEREIQSLFVEHTGYVPGICSVFSPTRMLQREELNPRKINERDYLAGFLADQYKIDLEKWRVAFVDPHDGSTYEIQKSLPKEVLVLGEAADELQSAQRRFLGLGVLPHRLEIATLPTLGGVLSYQNMIGDSQPAAVVEIDPARTRLYILGKNGVHTPAPIEYGFDALVEHARKELSGEYMITRPPISMVPAALTAGQDTPQDSATVRARLLAADGEVTARATRLLRPLVRNLKPLIDFFETQTGQRVNDLYCAFLPPGLSWLTRTLAASLQMQVLAVDCPAWLSAQGVTTNEDVSANLGPHWLSLFSLIAQLAPSSAYAKKAE
ncbi:MAG: hypothetical protein A3G75_02825 [Verrucomicrobia bacterium RIFCSPLOWO2_12_FULL_64_8]|nr:MAG: hypothetical protein A3G75_02825 [Verrucomicrobia bacterium RIFCSPLOWO2_12_FULL_64_8]